MTSGPRATSDETVTFSKEAEDAMADEMSEDSFPASDPPSTSTTAGPPAEPTKGTA